MAIIHFDTSKLCPGMEEFIIDKKGEYSKQKQRHVSGHSTLELLIKEAYSEEIKKVAGSKNASNKT